MAVGFLAIIWISQLGDHRDATRNAANYAANTKNQIAAECVIPLDYAKCAREIEEAARSGQRDEYDLYSQQTMALWTGVMGAMAVIGVAMSGVGVYLIWHTWDATREAAANSRKTLEAFLEKERAKIVVSDMEFYMPWCAPDVGKWEGALSLTVENVGDTAASKVKIRLECYLYNHRKRMNLIKGQHYVGTVKALSNEDVTISLPIAQADIELVSQDIANRVLVHITHSFEDIFGGFWERDFWLIAMTRGKKEVCVDHSTHKFFATDADFFKNTVRVGERRPAGRRARKNDANA